MKKNIAYSLCAMLLLSACSNDMKEVVDNVPVNQPTLQYMEFTASTGTDTRTQLTSDNKVVWQAGDAISIFDGTGNRKFTTKDSGASAIFGGNAASASDYYALYPYQEGATLSGNVIKNVILLSEQTAKAGSFDAACNLSVATASSNLQLAFKNVGSLVKFAVSNEQASKVRKVKLTSHDATAVLTGTVDITLGSQPAATPASGQQPYATLIADNGLEAGQYYYFAVLPSVLNAGFSLTFYDEQGNTWQKDYTKEANMARSNILKLAAIEVGAFTNSLLTNANLIAAAEESTGMTFTKNADGSVSLLNADNYQITMAVTRIDVRDKGDSSICDEIGAFSNLESLKCASNGITSIDLSKNTALTYLDCNYNQLYSLDLSKNAALTTLSCIGNQLNSLDLSKNIALVELHCDFNQLTSLDLSKNTGLTKFGCANNQLTSLDVSKNTALTAFSCGSNQLNRLDLSKNVALTDLACYYNQLTSLDLTNNTALYVLDCSSNLLTSLNLSKNTALKELRFYNNQLTSLDLSKNTALAELHCDLNQLASLDLTNNNQIDWSTLKVGSQKDSSNNDQTLNLYVNANQFSQPLPDIEENRNVNIFLKSDLLLTNANLIAAAEASTGRTFSKNADGSVSLSNDDNYQIAMAVTRIDVNGKGDPTVCEEIGVFSNLKYLDCSSNGITSLDLSKNSALTEIWCNTNQLTSLDLTNNTALLFLHCDDNQLTSLDLSYNTGLGQLHCDDNQLTSLDLSKNIYLDTFYCYDNQLSSLDLSKNTYLVELACAGNQLTSLDLSTNTVLTYLWCNNNQLTSLDLSTNTALTSLSCYSNQLTSLDISNNNQLNWSNLYVGSQTNNNSNYLRLYVDTDHQYYSLPDTEGNNKKVRILLKE